MKTIRCDPLQRTNGIDIHRTHYSNELSSNILGTNVRVAGWVEDVRILGALAFITLRDARGSAQVILRKNEHGNLFQEVEKLQRQSTVIVEGVLQKGKAKENPVEINCRDLIMVSMATHPLPIDPTGRVASQIDPRLDSRALDLRTPEVMAIFKIRHEALRSIRRTFIEKSFLEVSTPKIIGQAAEGGANLFSMDYFGNKAFLAQSPQLYKEQLTASLDRVFEIATFYRAERSHTRRHLSEFVSVDAEAAFLDENDAMSLAEDILVNLYHDISENRKDELEMIKHPLDKLTRPFKRITFRDAVRELQNAGEDIKEGDDLKDEALGKLGEKYPHYFWIVEWPTHLKPFYIERKDDDPTLSRSFDLQYGALELASGGRRVSSKNELENRLRAFGLDPKGFADHLKVFEWGMPPHSGWGLGLDRLMMVLTGKKNIRECVLYPRDSVRLLP